MAEDNLKDFTINWMVTGLLMVSLLAFSIMFMLNNNANGLGSDINNLFSDTYNNYSTNLIESPEDANTLLNITSKTNPEVSDLGSRDSVASAYEAKRSASQYIDAGKKLFLIVFSGTTGKILLSSILGMLGFLSFYYIFKFIRIGY